MKQKLVSILLAATLSMGTAVPALALDQGEINMAKGTTDWDNPESYVYNNESGVPDKGLYEAVVVEGDIDGDGRLTVEEAKDITSISIADFDDDSEPVRSLAGISHFKCLVALEISDYSNMDANGNFGTGQVTDLTPLAGMESLLLLVLDGHTRLTDIRPLASLPNLEDLSLMDTGVQDFSVLKGSAIRNLSLGQDNYYADGNYYRFHDYNGFIDALNQMDSLISLTLTHCEIPNAVPLFQLTELENLSLDDSAQSVL